MKETPSHRRAALFAEPLLMPRAVWEQVSSDLPGGPCGADLPESRSGPLARPRTAHRNSQANAAAERGPSRLHEHGPLFLAESGDNGRSAVHPT